MEALANAGRWSIEAACLGGEHQVLADREHLVERERWSGISYRLSPPRPGQFTAAHRELKSAAPRADEPGDDAQQRALTRAVGPHHGEAAGTLVRECRGRKPASGREPVREVARFEHDVRNVARRRVPPGLQGGDRHGAGGTLSTTVSFTTRASSGSTRERASARVPRSKAPAA